MNGSDIFYFMIMSGVAGLIYFVLFLLFPFLYFGIVEVFSSDYKNYKNIRWYLIISNIVAVALELLGIFVIFIVIAIFVSLVTFKIYQNKNKISARKNIEFMGLYFNFYFLLSTILFIAIFVDFYMLFFTTNEIFITLFCVFIYYY